MNDRIQMTNDKTKRQATCLFVLSFATFSCVGVTCSSANDEVAPTPIPMINAVPVRSSLYKQAMTLPVPPLPSAGEPAVAPTGAAEMAMYAVPASDAKRFKKHDLVTIIVSEISDMSTTSKNNNKKEQDFDAELKNFIDLYMAKGGTPAVGNMKSTNLPKLAFSYSDDRKASADQSRTDKMTLRITAEIVDVKPNGTLVVEATKRIRNDKEEQTIKLSGTCRVEDISADNTVLSTQLAGVDLSKDTNGEVRDGTKRGWLNRVLDKVNPF